MMGDFYIHINEKSRRVHFDIPKWTVIQLLFLLGFLILFFSAFKIGTVGGDEAAILINNLTGNIETFSSAGSYFYFGLTSDFHILDKKVERLDLTKSSMDQLKIKTLDGGDVYMDVTILYRLNPDMIKQVIQESGLGDAYKTKWVRYYARSICRLTFGKLDPEHFYTKKLDDAKEEAKKILNDTLNPHGIMVISVNPQKFSFYQEYEDLILEKKTAEQRKKTEETRLEEKLKDKDLKISVAEKTNENKIVEFKGQLQRKIIEANAEAEKIKKAAEGYAIKITQEAEANLVKKTKEAEGILLKKKAEAEGIRKLCEALAGPGGETLVRWEYAKRLKDFKISGRPYLISPEIRQVEVGGVSKDSELFKK